MYGGQLVDVLAPHNLRPAHLNAIYARLAQLGADVTPVASESSTASHHARGAGHEHHDTASSCGGARRSAAGVGDHDGSVDADGGVEEEYVAAAPAPAPAPARAPAAKTPAQAAVDDDEMF